MDLGFVGSLVLLCHAADIPLPCPEQLDRAMPRAIGQGDAQSNWTGRLDKAMPRAMGQGDAQTRLCLKRTTHALR